MNTLNQAVSVDQLRTTASTLTRMLSSALEQGWITPEGVWLTWEYKTRAMVIDQINALNPFSASLGYIGKALPV